MTIIGLSYSLVKRSTKCAPALEEGGVSYRPVINPVPGRTISLLYRHYSVRRPCFNELAARISSLMKALLG